MWPADSQIPGRSWWSYRTEARSGLDVDAVTIRRPERNSILDLDQMAPLPVDPATEAVANRGFRRAGVVDLGGETDG